MEHTCISISIEGSDGAGKATTTKLLVSHLQNLGKKVATISFPRYGIDVGGKLAQELLKSERAVDYDFVNLDPKLASLVYVIDRVEAKPHIEQMLRENDYLIFDRYVSSNFIHQGGKISDDTERNNLISFLSNLEYNEFGLPKIDQTFFLYLPVSIAQKNKTVQAKGKPDVVESNVLYLENSNKAGLWAAEKFGWELISCSGADGIQKSRETILDEVVSRVLGISSQEEEGSSWSFSDEYMSGGDGAIFNSYSGGDG